MVQNLRETASQTKAEGKAREIIQEWNTPVCNGKVAVIVEGRQDRDTYRKFFDIDKAAVRDLGGCTDHERVFDFLVEKGIDCIGIKDADYFRLCNRLIVKDGYFYTDATDLEMMILSDNSRIKELGCTFGVELPDEEIDSIFDKLKVISVIRWHNTKEMAMYNFRDFKLSNRTDEELSDFERLHNELVTRSSSLRHERMLTSEGYHELESQWLNKERKDCTRGHDLASLLARHFGNNVNEEKIGIALRSMFVAERFIATQLYAAIRNWENNHTAVLAV